jgi:arylsulfatase A-like enzyme
MTPVLRLCRRTARDVWARCTRAAARALAPVVAAPRAGTAAVVVTLLVFCPTVRAADPATAPTTRPNIVLFIGDDLTWHDIGPYGGTDVRTPNLDRLAKESVKFRRAFAASPTCTPSRSAMYTGLYPMRNGAHANHSLINDGITTLPVYMKNLGYRVVIAGKTHIGPRPEFPFEYLADGNIMPPGKKGVLWTDLNTAAIDRLLQDHDRSRPLCLIVAAHSPHVFWLPNDGYDPAKIKIPPYFVDTPETRRARCNYYTDVTHMDEQVGEVRASLDKHRYADNTLFMFTADQGAQWPFAKWSLYDAGIRTPLLAHWPGKTKDGSTTDAMVTLVDLLPTFIEAAGGAAPREIDGRSFLPVLTGRSDHHRDEVYAAHTGDREMNHAPERAVRTDRYKYIANLRPDIRYTTHVSAGGENDGKGYWASWLEKAKTDPAAARAIDRFHNKPAEELYDLEKDPYELNNLAADPAHADVLARLREKVKQWRVQQGEDPAKAPMPEDARSGELRYAG